MASLPPRLLSLLRRTSKHVRKKFPSIWRGAVLLTGVFCISLIVAYSLGTAPPEAIPFAIPPPLPRGGTLDSSPPVASDFLRPRVVEAAAVPCANSAKCALQLLVLTQGLCLPAFGYELRILGCVVGRDVYPLAASHSGVYVCLIPRRITAGEDVSVAVERNRDAERVRFGRVRVRGMPRGVVEEGDLSFASEDLVIHEGGKLGRGSEILVPATDVRWDMRDAAENRRTNGTGPVGGLRIDPEPDHAAQEGRFEICAMTQEKLSAEDLLHWVEYHRKLGVDMVYVYDNGFRASRKIAPEGAESDQQTLRLRDFFAERSDVELIEWPHVKSQITAQAHALLFARRRCEWLLLSDVDEWVMVGGGPSAWRSSSPPPLKRYVARLRRRKVDFSYLREIIMGPSGHRSRPSVPMPAAYTRLDTESHHALGKPLVRTDSASPFSRVHSVVLLHGGARVLKTRFRSAARAGEARLVHFKRRSWEDWVRKGRSGRGSIMVPDWSASRGANRWRADAPASDWEDGGDGKLWVDFRDSWVEVTRARTLPKQVVARTHGGWRCQREAPRGGGDVWGTPVCARHRPSRAQATSEVWEAAL